MGKATVEYCKFILEKVSFDERLFEKELHKAIKMLAETELKEFVDWLKKRFTNHKAISSLRFA